MRRCNIVSYTKASRRRSCRILTCALWGAQYNTWVVTTADCVTEAVPGRWQVTREGRAQRRPSEKNCRARPPLDPWRASTPANRRRSTTTGRTNPVRALENSENCVLVRQRFRGRSGLRGRKTKAYGNRSGRRARLAGEPPRSLQLTKSLCRFRGFRGLREIAAVQERSCRS